MDGLTPDDERRLNPETRKRVDQALDKAAREAARKTARRAAGGYFLLLLSLLIGAVVWQQIANQRLDSTARTARITAERVDSAELRACERLQAQRERTNVSEARQFLLLSAVAASPRASKLVKDRYGALAHTTLYDPPTDCAEALAHPNTYRRPASVPYHALPAAYAERVVMAARDKRPQPTP